MTDQANYRQFYQLYLAQLSSGCDSLVCKSKYCRSSPNFEFYNHKITEKALEFAEKGNQNLCPTLSPLLLKPSKLPQIAKCAVILNKFMHHRPINDLKSLINAYQDPDIFCHLLMGDECIITPSNLLFDDTIVDDFYRAIKKNKAIIECYQNFANLIDEINSKQPSLTKVRGLLLLLLFNGIHTQKNYINIYRTIASFQQSEMYVLFAALSTHQLLLSHVLETTHDFIRKYLIDNPDEHPHSQNMRVIASVVQLFYTINTKYDNPLPIRRFYNEKFCQKLDPRCEVELINITNVSYIVMPAILTLAFKIQTIEQERVLKSVEGHYNGQTFDIVVSRDNILQDIMGQLRQSENPPYERPIKITFKGETGLDDGGLSREFFSLISQQMIDPNYGMFITVNNIYYWFNPSHPEGEYFYKIVGYIVGLAAVNTYNISIQFPPLLFKKLVGKKLTIDDLVDLQPDFVTQIKDYDGDWADIGLAFETTIQSLDGTNITVELKPGGSNIDVTNDNIDEYISLYCDYYMNKSIEGPYRQFEAGFKQVVEAGGNQLKSCETIKSLSFDELSELVCGRHKFDWENLKRSIKYSPPYDYNSQTIVHFWEIFDEFTDDQKKDLYTFITAFKTAPVGGLRSVSITISYSGETTKFPTAHTCNLMLVLPDYKNKKLLKEKLLYCIENAEGFGAI